MHYILFQNKKKVDISIVTLHRDNMLLALGKTIVGQK